TSSRNRAPKRSKSSSSECDNSALHSKEKRCSARSRRTACSRSSRNPSETPAMPCHVQNMWKVAPSGSRRGERPAPAPAPRASRRPGGGDCGQEGRPAADGADAETDPPVELVGRFPNHVLPPTQRKSHQGDPLQPSSATDN